MNPEAEVIEFDVVDVITTSAPQPDPAKENESEWVGENANNDDGWSDVWF